MQAEELVIITGVSGSGKSTALNALEDMGYFAIENLPAALISPFVDFLLSLPTDWQVGRVKERGDRGEVAPPESRASEPDAYVARKFALALDCRDRPAVEHVRTSMERLRSAGTRMILIFLDAQDEVLMRRYQETRRPHPLLVSGAMHRTLGEALVLEREILADFRGAADVVIDTTSASPHELRRIMERIGGVEPALEITLNTFGFKYGLPHDVDLVVDVRFLPNPHFVPALRELTGLDRPVRDYVCQSADAVEFIKRYVEFLSFLIPHYQKEGKRYLQIGIGCTGGRHRSVVIGERLGERLLEIGFPVNVRHRDVNRAG